MNIYCFGDVHGEYDKLKSCIEQSPIKQGDTLISLGDLVDRGSKSYEVIEYCIELSKIYNCIFIQGNHDSEWANYINTRERGFMWEQGQIETNQSHVNNNVDPSIHLEFFKIQLDYYIDEDNNLFVHGGFNRYYHITDNVHNSKDVLFWDRDLIASARSYESMKDKSYPFKMKDNFKEVFIGHTPTYYLLGKHKPVQYANIHLLDTGAGKYAEGKVTLMNIQTKQYWQNEKV